MARLFLPTTVRTKVLLPCLGEVSTPSLFLKDKSDSVDGGVLFLATFNYERDGRHYRGQERFVIIVMSHETHHGSQGDKSQGWPKKEETNIQYPTINTQG